MEQEYTILAENIYRGYNYRLLKLKHNTGFSGVILSRGIFKYEIHITNGEGHDANIFVTTETALKEHAEAMINQLIKSKSN